MLTIVVSGRAPRKSLVEYIQLLCAKAQKLNRAELLRKSGDGQFRTAVSPGEKLAASIQDALLRQDYVNSKDNPDLAYIESLTTELTDQTDNIKLWSELFKKVDELTKIDQTKKT